MGKGEGQGEGHGEDAMEGLVAGGTAACCFLIFLWVIGLPMLLSGIALVAAFDDGDGSIYTAGIVLIVISCICIVIGVILIVLFFVVGAKNKRTGPTTTTTVQTHSGVQVTGTHTVHTNHMQVGYAVPPPGYAAYPPQPPPYSQNHPQQGSPYPPAGPTPTQPINPYQPPPGGATTSQGTPAAPNQQQMYPLENKHPGYKA